MTSDYNKTKETILMLYEKFCSCIEQVEGEKADTYKTSLTALEVQAKNIREEKFLLMAVGEAKSGKSTFINAYLGEDILPMGIKQCTSAIVEIRYGEQFVLRATRADGQVETILDGNRIKDFLKTYAAIDDDFRDIPVTTINLELLVKFQDKKIPERFIVDLIEGVFEEANVHELSKEDFAVKVRRYIKDNQPKWKSIVTQIVIEYPFKDEDLNSIQIIDSPGVNASGHVGDITDNFVENANAIMLLKPITGAALESTSFKKFFNTASADRSKGAMFLVLTRSGDVEDEKDILELHREAKLQFPNIQEQQVIYVDSQIRLYYNKFKDMTVEEIGDYIKAEKKRMNKSVLLAWYDSNQNRDEFLEELSRLSNFTPMNRALNNFAHRSQYLALNDFLKRMISVLEKTIADMEGDISLYKSKAEDPIVLANQINHINSDLQEIFNKISETINSIRNHYCETGGEIDKKVDEQIASFRKQLNTLNTADSKSIDELQKLSFRKIDMLKDFEDKLQEEIVAECDKELVALTDKSTINYVSLKPDITPEALKKVVEGLKESDAAKETTYSSGGSFTKAKRHSVFSQRKYFDVVASDIQRRLGIIKDKVVLDLKQFVTGTTNLYSDQLNSNADTKRKKLKEVQEQKLSSEEIYKMIEGWQGIVKELEQLRDKAIAFKGGVEKHV